MRMLFVGGMYGGSLPTKIGVSQALKWLDSVNVA